MIVESETVTFLLKYSVHEHSEELKREKLIESSEEGLEGITVTVSASSAEANKYVFWASTMLQAINIKRMKKKYLELNFMKGLITFFK